MEEVEKASVKKGKSYTEEKTISRSEADKMIEEAVKKAIEDYIASTGNKTAKSTNDNETVTLMFAGVQADGCYVDLGALGQINFSFGTIDVPKKDFLQKRSHNVDLMLKDRVLLVLNGLTDEELNRFGLNYSTGEVITSSVFYKMLDFSDEEILKIFSLLCDTHKYLMATVFISAYENGDGRVTQSKVKLLNDESKKTDPDGMFTPILAKMGQEFFK